MKSVRLHADGLRLEEIARPEPGPSEVLVRVQAAAITRDELTWPGDRLPAIPSYELAGVVEASGEEVIALTPFDRDGLAADYVAVPRDTACSEVFRPEPRAGGGSADAGAPPRGRGSSSTAGWWRAERVLITGVRGGVGHVAAQLVRVLGGALVGEGRALRPALRHSRWEGARTQRRPGRARCHDRSGNPGRRVFRGGAERRAARLNARVAAGG